MLNTDTKTWSFVMHLIFAVELHATYILFVPGTKCTGGRLAKTGVTSATVTRLSTRMTQITEVMLNKGHELCRLLDCEVQLSASGLSARDCLDMQLSFY